MQKRYSIQILSLTAFLFATLLQAQAANITGNVRVARAPDNSDAVIYIDKIPGKAFTPPAKPEQLDQLNLRFVPHVLVVVAGTKVLFPNSDIVRHNVFSSGPTRKFTLGTYPVGETRTQVFDKAGVVTLLCNIHAEMSAYIVVTDTAYFAKSDAKGNYTIPNVPPGRYVIKVWHEKHQKGSTMEITVGADNVTANFDLRN